MRGRTNVVQRKSPVINGAVSNFVVASGNTIAKGDFVSYELQTDVKEIAAQYTTPVTEVKRHSGNLFLIREYNDTKIHLVDVSNSFVTKDSLTYSSKLWFAVGSQGEVYVVSGTNLEVYNVVNSQFVLVGSVTLAKAACGVVWLKQTGKCAVITKSYTSGNTTFYMQLVTVSGSTVTVGSEITAYNLTTYSNTDCYFACLKDDTIVILTNRKKTSSSSVTSGWVVLSYSGGSVTTTNQSLDVRSSQEWSGVFIGENVILAQYYSSSTYYYNLYYVAQDLTVANKLLLSTSSSGSLVFPIGDDYFYRQYYNNSNISHLCRWNDETSEIEMSVVSSDGVNGGAYPSYLLGAFKQYDRTQVVFVLANARQVSSPPSTMKIRIRVYDETTLNMQDGYFSNVVKNYDGGNTVGFAKTGGSGGDTIQVYTPYGS